MKNAKSKNLNNASSGHSLLASLENRKNQIADFFTSRLMTEDDRSLRQQITLGSEWDDPFAVLQALDQQPELFSRWAGFRKDLEFEMRRVKDSLNVIENHTRLDMANWIFERNRGNGMTANQAKVAKGALDEHMAKYILQENKTYKLWHEQRTQYWVAKHQLEKVEIEYSRAEIICDAFKQRKDMLVSLTNLLRTLIENDFLEVSRAKKSVKNKPIKTSALKNKPIKTSALKNSESTGDSDGLPF